MPQASHDNVCFLCVYKGLFIGFWAGRRNEKSINVLLSAQKLINLSYLKTEIKLFSMLLAWGEKGFKSLKH